jgi:RHS repeat-associated protein
MFSKTGSTLKAVTPNRLASEARHFPYGETDGPPPSDTKDYFATYRRDGTGLDYAWNRYYSPTMGRFTTADPYGGSATIENPSSWNRYTYSRNDPGNYLDPVGLEEFSTFDFFLNIYNFSPTSISVTATYCPSCALMLLSLSIGGTGGGLGVQPLLVVDISGLPQEQPPTPVGPVELLDYALDLSIDAIKGRSDCRNLFGEGADPAEVLERVKKGDNTGPLRGIVFEEFSRSAGDPLVDGEMRPAEPTLLPIVNRYVIDSGVIAINTLGSWSRGWDGSRPTLGNLTDDQFRAMLLLHELMHLYDLVEGIGGSMKNLDHAKFDEEIVSRCLK